MDDLKTRERYVEEGGTNIPEYAPIITWPYDCAINVFRAMLNEVGLIRTIDANKHYNEAWGRAVIGMVKERFGEQQNDLESLAMTGYYVHSCTSMGHIKPLEIYEGGAICELFACPNPGLNAPPEMCVAMSHVMTNGYCQMINPDYEFIFTHHMGNGDDCCRWVVKEKGSKFTSSNLGKLLKTVPLELSMEEKLAFAGRMVIMSQLFTFTSALNDLVGSDRTLELVVPMARETGLRIGNIMKDSSEVKDDLSTIGAAIDLLVSYWGLQQGDDPAIVSNSGIEKEITDCSCKGSMPEVCKQFEGVINGVCEVINPDYEFVYDRMMSKGDQTCHWVVRKKKEKLIVVREMEPKETALELLKKRLVKGEINEGEYERLKNILDG